MQVNEFTGLAQDAGEKEAQAQDAVTVSILNLVSSQAVMAATWAESSIYKETTTDIRETVSPAIESARRDFMQSGDFAKLKASTDKAIAGTKHAHNPIVGQHIADMKLRVHAENEKRGAIKFAGDISSNFLQGVEEDAQSTADNPLYMKTAMENIRINIRPLVNIGIGAEEIEKFKHEASKEILTAGIYSTMGTGDFAAAFGLLDDNKQYITQKDYREIEGRIITATKAGAALFKEQNKSRTIAAAVFDSIAKGQRPLPEDAEYRKYVETAAEVLRLNPEEAVKLGFTGKDEYDLALQTGYIPKHYLAVLENSMEAGGDTVNKILFARKVKSLDSAYNMTEELRFRAQAYIDLTEANKKSGEIEKILTEAEKATKEDRASLKETLARQKLSYRKQTTEQFIKEIMTPRSQIPGLIGGGVVGSLGIWGTVKAVGAGALKGGWKSKTLGSLGMAAGVVGGAFLGQEGTQGLWDTIQNLKESAPVEDPAASLKAERMKNEWDDTYENGRMAGLSHSSAKELATKKINAKWAVSQFSGSTYFVRNRVEDDPAYKGTKNKVEVIGKRLNELVRPFVPTNEEGVKMSLYENLKSVVLPGETPEKPVFSDSVYILGEQESGEPGRRVFIHDGRLGIIPVTDGAGRPVMFYSDERLQKQHMPIPIREEKKPKEKPVEEAKP